MASIVDLALVVASILLIVGGITYWLYSTIEQQGRKIGILENVLYELRYAIQNRAEAVSQESAQSHDVTHSHPSEDAPFVSEDADESVKMYATPPTEGWEQVANSVRPPPDSLLDEEIEASVAEFDLVKDDGGHDMLRPGGGIELDEDNIMSSWTNESNKEEKFKNLFDQPAAQTKDIDISAPSAQRPAGASIPQTLESMTLKDLRNLAVGRKISGAKAMKRAELLDALQGGSSDEPISVSGPVPVSD